MPSKANVTHAAQILGSLGGARGGRASSSALTPQQRKDRARRAVVARWAIWRKAHPTHVPRAEKLSATEQALLTKLHNFGGPMAVTFDPSKRPTGGREYKAAFALVGRGVVLIDHTPEPEGAAHTVVIKEKM